MMPRFRAITSFYFLVKGKAVEIACYIVGQTCTPFFNTPTVIQRKQCAAEHWLCNQMKSLKIKTLLPGRSAKCLADREYDVIRHKKAINLKHRLRFIAFN